LLLRVKKHVGGDPQKAKNTRKPVIFRNIAAKNVDFVPYLYAFLDKHRGRS